MKPDRPQRPAGPCSEAPHPASITCREIAEFLLEYTDGALPARERTEFDRHIEECPPCVAYIATYTRTVRLEKAALCGPSDEIPPDVPEALVRAILAARTPATRTAKKSSAPRSSKATKRKSAAKSETSTKRRRSR